jgi:uncharacterized 2Fe-2S/4Fe-4S cluster protein (DUF4445 family)
VSGCRLRLTPSGRHQLFTRQTLLADALMDMGLAVRSPCGGKGICGKCMVKVTGDLSGQSHFEAKALKNRPGMRLACQAVIEGDVEVFMDETSEPVQQPCPGLPKESRYGLACDIGTTTVRISLVDLESRNTFPMDSFLNPQRRFGHDVISRIAACSDPAKEIRQTDLIRSSVFNAMLRFLEACGMHADCCELMVFSGNTTMLSLFFSLDVVPLGRYPYEVKTRDFTGFTPADMGAIAFPGARILALPVLSAFIGGDLMGGLTLCRESGIEKNAFFIDLGTNGELFVMNGNKDLFATSCAMGPALESMNIAWGMTAEDGAITAVDDGPAGGLTFSVMGNGEPAGISGTALVDLTAILLRRGIIRHDGAFCEDFKPSDLPSPLALDKIEGMKALRLQGDIRFTQRDIRNLQLAKAAGLAASRILLKESGMDALAIEQVLIAGAFGEHLNLENFKTLGFLPDFPNASWQFLGNTSMKAAETACMDDMFMNKASCLRDQVREVELSLRPGFEDEFIRCTAFPMPSEPLR